MNSTNGYFVAAAALAFVVGLAHSVLGERLIFSRLRQGGWVPTNGGNVPGQRYVGILWASWHIVTIFGWCIAAVLWQLATPSAPGTSTTGIEQTIAITALAGAVLVCVGTRARHPGWVGLLAIALCVWLGQPR